MGFGRRQLQNEFSWSKSRHEKLSECARQYFFHYYGSWGGWERNAAPEVRELYTLKKLTARPAWAGSTVHDSIARALTLIRDRQPVDAGGLLDQTRARMRAEFRESREKAYRQRKAFGLIEHEYDEAIADEVWRNNWTFVESCIQAFLASRWPGIASDLQPERWLPIDELGSFAFDRIKIYAAPDFAFRTADGGVVLIDWKTGQRRESDREQLRGYAMYARDAWDVPLEKIECRVVYLPSADEVEVRVDEAEVAAFSERMRGSIAHMHSLLDDVAGNVASIGNFPPTDDEKACARCVFRRPCKGS